jgi:putative tryptophan/tyrosine transport system substrate-binding protein
MFVRVALWTMAVMGVVVVLLGAEAQPRKVAQIGVLSLGFPDRPDDCVNALRRALDDLGYAEGRTHVFHFRWAGDRMDRLPDLAAGLVRMNPDVLVSASGPAALTAKESTGSIPVVLATSFYPVELGIIASLARPGGNVTGVTHVTPELIAKRVQLVKELVPGVARIAVIRLPGRLQDLVVRDMDRAARQLGVELQLIGVATADDLRAAFDIALRGRAQAVMTTQSSFFWHHRAEIARLALTHRLPTLSGEPGAAEAGMLVSYGPDVIEGCAHAARYVDRILKGARPADLPVEEPTRIKMVLNLKTAKALGIPVPASLLARADHVLK